LPRFDFIDHLLTLPDRDRVKLEAEPLGGAAAQRGVAAYGKAEPFAHIEAAEPQSPWSYDPFS
jgi:hypothetical protein